jgi:hypothetical protein
VFVVRVFLGVCFRIMRGHGFCPRAVGSESRSPGDQDLVVAGRDAYGVGTAADLMGHADIE